MFFYGARLWTSEKGRHIYTSSQSEGMVPSLMTPRFQMDSFVSPRQLEAYEVFKKYSIRHGRFPTITELSDSLGCSNYANAIYLAGMLLLKGGFGHKVAVQSGIVDFSKFSFPMANDQTRHETAQQVTVASPTVAALEPEIASKYANAPVAIRNLIKKVEVAKKQKTEKPVEAMKRDVMGIMNIVKEYGISANFNSRLITETLNESGKSYKPKQIAWVVGSLIKEQKLKGHASSFTYF